MKNNTRIIIIEDDPDTSSLIAYNLRKEGYIPEQVFDGAQAKAKLETEPFDIVILDVMLPAIDGFEICRLLKESRINNRSFVIMVSARCSQQDKLYAHILGADYYLSKPFSVAALIKVIHEVEQMQGKDFTVKYK